MQRSSNFSVRELEVLVNSLESYKELVSGELGKSYANLNEQKEAWSEIAEILNSVGLGVKRTGQQVKNKWIDLKSRTKKKAAKIKNNHFGTGGGPSTNMKLSYVEEKVLALIGKTCVEGITSLEFDTSAQYIINEQRKLEGNTSENSAIHTPSQQNTALVFTPRSLNNDNCRPQYHQQNLGSSSVNNYRISDGSNENFAVIENDEMPTGNSTSQWHSAAETPQWHLGKRKNTGSTIRNRRMREKRKRIEMEKIEDEEKDIIQTQKNICNLLAQMHNLFEKSVENQRICIENQRKIIENEHTIINILRK
ncbi:myb-related transcription factor, partner of profilin-like isoform X1 [Stegodyphus dumicola]|uniref:myb-related transcription factor, partner of profilin-like isoform X1 n=1 Tax=Stegodyphus dumicola TaxID=202533 RepID=UPI0015AC80C0|nr:myb-related transcription factor, partner of profilin-like isoform X1 [Stegodyphus dumicola]